MDYVLPIKAGVSVYHVALAGRVQRYSPIYYPDSHANSALAAADSPLGCLCLACSSVYALLYPLLALPTVSPHLRPSATLRDRVLLAGGRIARTCAPVHRYIQRMRFVIPANPTILRRAALRGRDFR